MEYDQKLFIKDLTLRTKKGYICVRVMRKWNYDGNVPGGPVFYIGLLLADEQGTPIYGQIAESEIPRLGPQLALDNVYTIRRFNVRVSKAGYVPFDTGIMLQITSFTTITPAKVPIDNFPKILYQITPFNRISTSVQATMKYIDVIGILTKEDVPKTACPKGKEYVSTLKEVVITDLSGSELTVTLWEKNVHQFVINDPSPTEPAHSIVVLFCGCLPKKIFNKTQVNAGNACRWFLNPDIPEAQPLYDRLKTNPVPIQRPHAAESLIATPVRPRSLQQKLLAEMNAMDPYEFPEEGCKCTITIRSIPDDQEWWYMGCEVCKKRLRNNGGTYYCVRCNCSVAIPLYKLTFVAADDSDEAKFFCYDVNARQIVHRNCDSLLRAANNVSGLPDQILRAIGRTYTFAVGLTEQSYTSMDNRVYLIDSCVYKPPSQNPDPTRPLSLESSGQVSGQEAGSSEATHQSDQETSLVTHAGGNENDPPYNTQTPLLQTESSKIAPTTPVSQCQTIPAQAVTKQSATKGSTNIEPGVSEERQTRAQHARKRLFETSAPDNEAAYKSKSAVGASTKKVTKKGKTDAVSQEAETSDNSASSGEVEPIDPAVPKASLKKQI